MTYSAARCRLGLSAVPFVASAVVKGFELQLHKHSLSSVLSRETLGHKSSLPFFSIAYFSSQHNTSSSIVDLLGVIDEERNCADQRNDGDARSSNIASSMRSCLPENIDVLVSRPSPAIGKEHDSNIRTEDHDVEGGKERTCRPVSIIEQEGESLEFSCSAHEDQLVRDKFFNLPSYEGPGFREGEAEGYHRKHKHKVESQGERFHLLKSRGQHLLTNPRVLDSIIQKAKVLPTDTVLEVGPGTGNLTVRLLEYARKVIAVEIDERMVDTLQNRIGKLGLEDRLSVIKGNVLKVELPHFDICVSNIPYGISSPLIAKLFLLPRKTCFRSAVLLLQKEFARRLLAKPGESDFNRLAVNVGFVASVNFLMNVSKKDFVPCPKVDSSLVQIQPKPYIPDINLDEWLGFIRTCFGQRNKTLFAMFKQKKKIIELYGKSKSSSVGYKTFHYEDQARDYDIDEKNESENADAGIRNLDLEGQDSTEILSFRDKIVRILKDGGFGEKRPSKLSNEDFLCLLNLFNKDGIFFH